MNYDMILHYYVTSGNSRNPWTSGSMLSSEKCSAGWTCEDLRQVAPYKQLLRGNLLEIGRAGEARDQRGMQAESCRETRWICQPANLGRPLVDCIVVDCGADQRRITEGTEHSAKNSINMPEPGG